MQTTLYSWTGEDKGKIGLNGVLWGNDWNVSLVHQVATVQNKNERQVQAKTKSRGEVRGGGKKPWAQKHTGRARHGSIRSPIWVGGGVIFGPRLGRNFKRSLTKKMSARALFMVLASKLKEKYLFVTEELALSEPKTKLVHGLISNFMHKTVGETYQEGQKILVVADDDAKTTARAFRNLATVRFVSPDAVSALLLLRHKYIILPQSALTKLESERGRVLNKTQ